MENRKGKIWEINGKTHKWRFEWENHWKCPKLNGALVHWENKYFGCSSWPWN